MKAGDLQLSRTEAEGLLRALNAPAMRTRAMRFCSLSALEKLIDWLEALVLGEGMESP